MPKIIIFLVLIFHLINGLPSQKYVANLNDCLERHTTFCTKMRNRLNLDHINDVLKRDFGHYMKNAEMKHTKRINFSPDEESACKSRENIIYPTMGESDLGVWRFIVNDGNFQQSVRVEECLSDDKPNNDDYDIQLPEGYKGKCKQFYIYRPMVSLTIDGQPRTELFRMPSCCKLILIRDTSNDN